MIDLTPFRDFEAASRATLAFLHQRLGFSLWMMTRKEGQDWIVLQAEDHGYNVKDGTVFRWADSYCSQMVLGAGPQCAPRAQDIPVFAAAPVNGQVQIGAYMGIPMAREDGTLFGTLCAIDPQPQKESIRNDLPLLQLLGKLLGAVLDAELKKMEQTRLLERSQMTACTDKLTGLLNRHGWEENVAKEEDRARCCGSPSGILIIDLDDLKKVNDTGGHAQGDILIQKAAECLRGAVREGDTIARIGGDEFAILGVECDTAECEAMFQRITKALLAQHIHASIGQAQRDPSHGLIKAIAEADRAMYAVKAERRSSRAAGR